MYALESPQERDRQSRKDRNGVCAECLGTGSVPVNPKDLDDNREKDCPACGGTGR